MGQILLCFFPRNQAFLYGVIHYAGAGAGAVAQEA